MILSQEIFFVIYLNQDKSLLYVKVEKADTVTPSSNQVLIEFLHYTKEEMKEKKKL
jgi:hypothetical protein